MYRVMERVRSLLPYVAVVDDIFFLQRRLERTRDDEDRKRNLSGYFKAILFYSPFARVDMRCGKVNTPRYQCQISILVCKTFRA